MNKFLLFVCSALLIGFNSCSSDDDSTTPDAENISIDEAYRRKMIEEYGLKETGALSIIKASANESIALFEGRINNHLWIRCYNIANKEIILQWQDTEELKKSVDIDLGYGNKKTVAIDRYHSYKWLYTDESLIFQLIGDHDNINYFTTATHDVYFISQNRLVNKIHTNIYPSIYYGELISWYKGVKYTINDEGYTYDAYGTPIQLVGYFSRSNDFTLIDYYQCIDFDKEKMRRLNYKNGTIMWKIKSPLADIPETARKDNYDTQLNGNIWTYTFNYTCYDGTKINRIFELNIDTGEIKILKLS